jgi:hypothetical protein
MSDHHNERIRREIRECRAEIEKYSEYEYEMRCAEDYCKQAGNGISLLMNEQYENVKMHCIEAIGEEDDLLSALKVKHSNLHDINLMLLEDIQDGICGIQEKIEELRERIQMLLGEL